MEKNRKFLELLSGLNYAQQEAVDTVEGAVMVIAGPGTGKTQILTLRIANILLKTDVNPENILALTFTESGVSAMRKRLVSVIGTPGYRVNIYTFHGFCNDLIQSNLEDFPHLISAEAAAELDQIAIVEDFIKNSTDLKVLRPFGDPLYYVRPSLSAISDLKKEGITVDKFEQGIIKEEADFETIPDLYHERGTYKGRMKGVYEKQLKNIAKNKELVLVYRAYQEGLRKNHLYDFNDMLLEVIKVLEAMPELLLRLQEQYQYFLVDEHQDTNAAQNRIVELLCNYYPNPNLFVVGDEKQAIYRFQGASLENFLYFKNLYPQAMLISLTENYRSSQTILDASDSLMQVQSSIKEKGKENNDGSRVIGGVRLLARAGHAEHKVKVVRAMDFYSEYYAIGEEIKKKLESKGNYRALQGSEIAILGKENRDLLPFIDVFDRLGIQYVIESNQNILADLEIQKLLLLFRTIANIGSDELLIKAMHIDCLGIHPVDIYKLMQAAKEKQISLWEVISQYQTCLPADKVSNIEPACRQTRSPISNRNEDLNSSKQSSEERGLLLELGEKILEFYQLVLGWKKTSYNERFDSLFKNVVSESGFLKSVLAKKNAFTSLDKITGLYEEVKAQIEKNPMFDLDDFIAYLHLIEQHEIKLTKTTKTFRTDAVRLMTAHKSKGLEFDYVYIINAFDGHWGNARKRGNSFTLSWMHLVETQNLPAGRQGLASLQINADERNDDERRLFYVALTRARKEAVISYSMYGRDGKEQVPSQFINEIKEEYREELQITEFEKDFLTNKQLILTPIRDTNMAEKGYFNELFRKRGFAVTHLNNYLRCPWRYFFRDLVRIPEPMEKTALYGSAIHRALNAYLVKNQKSKIRNQNQGVLFDDLDVVGEPKNDYREGLAPIESGLEFLITAFDKALAENSLRKQDMEELLKKGKKSLTGYYAMYMTQWKDNLLGEFSIKGIRFSEDVMLTGRLDMIDCARSDQVIVYDFKTGKPKSRNEIEGTTKNGSGDYKRQLVFYKLLLDKYQYKKLHMKMGVIDFVEPTDKGEYKREVFTIGEDEVKQLEAQIKEVTDEILALAFWDKRCDEKDCEYCALRGYMGS